MRCGSLGTLKSSPRPCCLPYHLPNQAQGLGGRIASGSGSKQTWPQRGSRLRALPWESLGHDTAQSLYLARVGEACLKAMANPHTPLLLGSCLESFLPLEEASGMPTFSEFASVPIMGVLPGLVQQNQMGLKGSSSVGNI